MEYGTEEKKFLALDHVNLKIEEGEFICLIGHSGCGKSTLLSAIDGLLPPAKTGGIYIDNKKVTAPGASRAMIFQNYSLFPWLTATDNVIFANEQVHPEFKKKKKKEKREYARKYLEIVGLEDAADKYPGELSGGMQQRIAIARALSVQPDILLADEPFGALDPRTRTNLQNLMMDIWAKQEKKITVIFVTHDIDEVLLMADRIVFMDPKVITEVMVNPLPRPRRRSELIRSETYNKLRNHLTALFYRNEEQAFQEEEKPMRKAV